MWQSNSRKTASSSLVHGVELRSARDFHLKRVECRIASAEGEPTGSPISARLLLNDLNASGLAVYSPETLSLGSLVSLEFDYPEKMSLRARVGWCQQLTSGGKVLSERSQAYRIGLVWEHEKPEDQDRVKAFCEKLAEIYPGIDLTRAPYAA